MKASNERHIPYALQLGKEPSGQITQEAGRALGFREHKNHLPLPVIEHWPSGHYSFTIPTELSQLFIR
jgi:hypothetical protein